MKWILIFLICVFGCIFCVVHLGSKAKRHLANFSAEVIEDELIEDGENWTPDPNENVTGNRGWTDKPDVYGRLDEEYMEMQGGGYRDDSPSVIAEKADQAGGYQYQEYQVDDDNLVEDIEDDLPPLMEGEIDEEFLVEDDVEIEGDIEDLTPEEVAELDLNDAQQADSEIDQEDELPPVDIELDDGFLDEEPDSYTNVDEEPAAPADNEFDSEKADEVAPHDIESFEEALHLAEEDTHNEDPPAEATKATKKKTRQGKKRTDRKRDPTKRGKGKNRSNLDEMDIEFNDQDQERIVRVDL